MASIGRPAKLVSMGRRRHWAGPLCVTLGLLPLAFAVATVSSRPGTGELGIAQALGCSGSGQGPIGPVTPPTPGWQHLGPSAGVLFVGTDGFFNLDGQVEGLGLEEAVAGVTVVVHTEAGVDVPGELTVIQDKGPSEIRLGWTAAEAVADGTTLTAIIRGSPAAPGGSVGGVVRLSVVGPPLALPMPSVVFGSWWDRYRGMGTVVRCANDLSFGGTASSCGFPPVPLDVSPEYELERQVDLEWQAPSTLLKEVAWRVQVAQSSSDADDIPDSPIDVVYLGRGGSPFAAAGAIHFSPQATEVCTTVVLTDLRTGEAQSDEICQAPMPPSLTTSGDELGSCSAPPTEDAADLWCKLRTELQRDCVARMPEGANAKPIEGCQFGRARSAPGWGLAWAVLALVSFRWRLTQSSWRWRLATRGRSS